MKWRWLLFDYVDPQLSLSGEERRRVRYLAWDAGLRPTPGQKPVTQRSFLEDITEGRPWYVLLIGVLQWLLPYFLLVGLTFLWGFFFRNQSPFVWLALYPLFFLLTWITLAVLWRISWQRRVIRGLRRVGYEVCWKCGYWLKGLADVDERCPECGTPRERMEAP